MTFHKRRDFLQITQNTCHEMIIKQKSKKKHKKSFSGVFSLFLNRGFLHESPILGRIEEKQKKLVVLRGNGIASTQTEGSQCFGKISLSLLSSQCLIYIFNFDPFGNIMFPRTYLFSAKVAFEHKWN